MRIVNRKDFLALPKGTLFQKFDEHGLDLIEVKGETLLQQDDYQTMDINAVGDQNGDIGTIDILEDTLTDGCFVPLDFNYFGRDGEFNDRQLYAILDKEDFVALLKIVAPAYGIDID